MLRPPGSRILVLHMPHRTNTTAARSPNWGGRCVLNAGRWHHPRFRQSPDVMSEPLSSPEERKRLDSCQPNDQVHDCGQCVRRTRAADASLCCISASAHRYYAQRCMHSAFGFLGLPRTRPPTVEEFAHQGARGQVLLDALDDVGPKHFEE
jgi:hypothetical protein